MAGRTCTPPRTRTGDAMFDDTLDTTPHDVPLEATGVGTHEVTHYGDVRVDVYDFDSDGSGALSSALIGRAQFGTTERRLSDLRDAR